MFFLIKRSVLELDWRIIKSEKRKGPSEPRSSLLEAISMLICKLLNMRQMTWIAQLIATLRVEREAIGQNTAMSPAALLNAERASGETTANASLSIWI